MSIDKSQGPVSPYGLGTGHTFPLYDSSRDRNVTSTEAPSADESMLIPSFDRPLSPRDIPSTYNTNIATPRHGTVGTQPPLTFTTNLPATRNTAKAQSSDRNQPRSHDFVMETYKPALRGIRLPRSKRRGKLSESSASSARRLRSIGACWSCKLKKSQVSILKSRVIG